MMLELVSRYCGRTTDGPKNATQTDRPSDKRYYRFLPLAARFMGSLPHFRRYRPDRINLLTFQHSMDKSAFVIELANCPPDGTQDVYGNTVPPNKITAHHMFRRSRPGSHTFSGDYRFDYGSSFWSVDVSHHQTD